MQQYLSFIKIFGAILVTAVLAAPVSAHVERSVGAVSAELHIEPNDAPVAGQTIALRFGFSSTDSGLSLASCDCHVTVTELDRYSATLSLTQLATEPNSSEQPFTFPHSGEYKLTVIGQLRSASGSAPFTLTFPVHVAAPPAKPINPFAYIGYGLAAMLFAGGLWAVLRRIDRASR